MLDPYVYEKLRKFAARDNELHYLRYALRSRAQVPAKRRPSLRPVVRFAGVALHRLGERLECWADPGCPDMEAQPVRIGRAR